MPRLLDKAVNKMKSSLQQTLTYIMNNVNMLTTLIEDSYEIVTVENRRKLSCDDVKNANINKDLLILFRQYELSIR